jgi:hypothetical protein
MGMLLYASGMAPPKTKVSKLFYALTLEKGFDPEICVITWKILATSHWWEEHYNSRWTVYSSQNKQLIRPIGIIDWYFMKSNWSERGITDQGGITSGFGAEIQTNQNKGKWQWVNGYKRGTCNIWKWKFEVKCHHCVKYIQKTKDWFVRGPIKRN